MASENAEPYGFLLKMKFSEDDDMLCDSVKKITDLTELNGLFISGTGLVTLSDIGAIALTSTESVFSRSLSSKDLEDYEEVTNILMDETY